MMRFRKEISNGRLRVVFGVLLAIAIAGAPRAVLGQCEVEKLLASDGVTYDYFGNSVSITGTPGDPGHAVAIIGARGGDDNAARSGSAYIYRFNGSTWNEEARLLASDGAEDDAFGYSVSITGPPGNEVAIVGAYKDDDDGLNSGSAYIFRFNPDTSEWVEEVKLLASDGAADDHFGYSVSISGAPGNEVALVGAPGDNIGTPWDGDLVANVGSAYVYRFNGAIWAEEAKLLTSDGTVSDTFGYSVSMDNNVAIVGAVMDDDIGYWSGSAYIYRFDPDSSGWVEEAKLLASDGVALDNFGISVSVSHEVAIVGALGDDEFGEASGSSYIFRFDGMEWIQETEIFASDSDGPSDDLFGYSVSINCSPGNPGHEVAIIGSRQGNGNAPLSGATYIFRPDPDTSRWIEEAKLVAADGASSDYFGDAVSVNGDIVVVGARADDDLGLSSGSAFYFDLGNLFSCPADTDCDDLVGVADLVGLLAAWGACPAPCPDDNDDSGTVDVFDLLVLLSAWGPCP